MVHEAPISAFGWSGSGYILFDPAPGSGAYRISGGLSGGSTLPCPNAFATTLAWSIIIVVAIALAAAILFYVAALIAAAIVAAGTTIGAAAVAFISAMILLLMTSNVYSATIVSEEEREACWQQFDDDVIWCITRFKGSKRLIESCHQWASTQVHRCYRGCSRQPFQF